MNRTLAVVALTIVAAAALSLACGGKNNQSSDETPTATRVVIPSGAGIVRTPVEPQAVTAAGRDDCPADWLVYEETPFSICYPPDHYTHVWSKESEPSLQYLSMRLEAGDPVAYNSWGLTLWRAPDYEPPATCQYETEHVAPEADTQLASYEIDGAAGVACTARIDEGTQFKGMVPAPFGGLAFEVNTADEEQLDLAKQILQTFRFEEL